MSNGPQADFLRRVNEVPGVLGCGLLLHADRSRLLRANALARFPDAALEAVLRATADTFHVLHLHRQEVQRLRWVFDQASLHGLWRREEAVLAVLTVKNFRLLDHTALERLFLEFSRRPPGGGGL